MQDPIILQQTTKSATVPQGGKLLDRFRLLLIDKGYVPVMVEQHAAWARGYILFHGTRHPQDMGGAEARQYLEHVGESKGAKDREQARAALVMLYQDLLGQELQLPKPKRLLDQVHEVMRVGHYSVRTEECYVHWIKRYIFFHGTRHPAEMGGKEIAEFLTHLAVRQTVSASTQAQALNALVFLYKQVLDIDPGRFDAVRAQRPRRLPVVMSRAEVRAVLAANVPSRICCFATTSDHFFSRSLRITSGQFRSLRVS